MNSNNFIEIKINMEHVFLGLLPPTHLTTHTFLPTQTPGDLLSGPLVLSTAQCLMKDRTLNLGDPPGEEDGRRQCQAQREQQRDHSTEMTGL